MKSNKKYMWELLVPANNMSVEIPVEYHNAWDEKVKNIAGGLTIYKQTRGIWIGPNGEKFHDVMIPVRLYCTKEQFDVVLDLTLEHYMSEQVILGYKISTLVVFKTRTVKTHQE
jgi:hypothetical protein